MFLILDDHPIARKGLESIIHMYRPEDEVLQAGTVKEAIESMRRQMDEEGLDEDDLECPEQSSIDELSDMLTKAFQAWADKHGYDKSIAYGTNVERYDLKTGRLVLE